jgi:hypothetical protein
MVRSIPTGRSKTGGRESIIPSLVDEHPVQTDKGGGGSTIRPGELAVPKGELKKREIVDGVIEEISVGRGEISVVSIHRVPGKVKITGDEPRKVNTGIMGPKAVEEANLTGTVAGSVDICDPKGGAVVCEGKVNG